MKELVIKCLNNLSMKQMNRYCPSMLSTLPVILNSFSVKTVALCFLQEINTLHREREKLRSRLKKAEQELEELKAANITVREEREHLRKKVTPVALDIVFWVVGLWTFSQGVINVKKPGRRAIESRCLVLFDINLPFWDLSPARACHL